MHPLHHTTHHKSTHKITRSLQRRSESWLRLLRKLRRWKESGKSRAYMHVRAAELQVDAEALARVLTHDDAQDSNPYGCNGAGHKQGCSRGNVQRLTAPEKWKPASLPYMVGAAQRLRMLKDEDPTGEAMRLDYDIFRHWVREGKSLSDIRTRLKSLNRVAMAIRQAHEIWWNDKGGAAVFICPTIPKRKKNKRE